MMKIPVLKEVDLERSAQRGTNRLEAPVNLPKVHAFKAISKQTPEKVPNQSILVVGIISRIISGFVTPKVKRTKFTNQKVRPITKSVISFQSFAVTLRRAFAPKELPALKYKTNMNRDNKSAS